MRISDWSSDVCSSDISFAPLDDRSLWRVTCHKCSHTRIQRDNLLCRETFDDLFQRKDLAQEESSKPVFDQFRIVDEVTRQIFCCFDRLLSEIGRAHV